MGTAGQQWVESQYSHFRLLRNVEALYEDLLALELKPLEAERGREKPSRAIFVPEKEQ
jgi:hypothetical protein